MNLLHRSERFKTTEYGRDPLPGSSAHLWARRPLKKSRETDTETEIERKCMSFTVEEFGDLVLLLAEQSAWRVELHRLGLPDELLIPVVAGWRPIAEAAELARTKQVWQIMNGYALSPEPIPPSL
jgi:hypothetical protein